MPIGNLTSQIFANIYLNELDRFVVHVLRPGHYLRYGDDFILVCPDLEKMKEIRARTIHFLHESLMLNLNPKNDKILRPDHGLRFLGVLIWPKKRCLNDRAIQRLQCRLSHRNFSSYFGLVGKHGYQKLNKKFMWLVQDLMDSKNE